MSSVIDSIEQKQLRRRPRFDAGDRVRVHFQVIEGTRRRTQVFDGIVIKLQGSGARETFTVRKQSFGVGVERTFPLHSPKIEKIEVASRGEVRRAKLYYLRDRVGRRARVRERVFTGADEEQLMEMADAQGLQEDAVPVDVAPPEAAEGEDAASEAQADGAADDGAGEPAPDAAGEGEGEAESGPADAGEEQEDQAPESPDQAEQE